MNFISAHQTLIVGILGFIGVMATLAFNARLARKAEDRKIAHERRVLRVALVEEMKVQRDALLHAGEGAKVAKTGKEPKQDALTPLRRWTDVFERSIDRLGLLNPDEVAAVLDAYLPLKELTSKIRILESRIPPHQRRVEYSDAPPPDYALVAHKDLEVLAELHAIYAPSFDKAIKLVSTNL
ncbi:MAG: hypothetical protein IT536_21315 [Hyphomicrobiales bacterium]|nr:hypothetical protein [Hyphomicrobiales bacterium]